MASRFLVNGIWTLQTTPTGSVAAPIAPSPSVESVASGSSFSNKTFSAFVDADSAINSYAAVTTNVSGDVVWSGSNLGPYTAASSSEGDAGTLSLNAIDGTGKIVSTAIHSYSRQTEVSGGAWNRLKDYDLTTVTTTGAITTGTTTLAFSGGESLDITVSRYSGANGSITPTPGTGLLWDGGSSSGTVTGVFQISSIISGSWDRQNLNSYVYAIHLVLESVSFPSSGNSRIFSGLNVNANHNSGDARGWFIEDDGSGQEDRKTRNNTSNSSLIDTVDKKDVRVLTSMLIGGEMVQVMDTTGSNPPTPVPGGSSTITVGADSVGQLDTTPRYLTCYAYAGAGDQTDWTMTRMIIERYK